MRHLGLVTFASLFLVAAANPLVYNMVSTRKGPQWGFFHHTANQAADKTGPTNNVNWMWKSSIEDSRQHTQESEEEHKRNLEAERLHVRLRQELAELWEKLHPYTDTRACLGTLIHQLQETLGSSAQELCNRLHQYVQEPEPSKGLTLSPEAMQWINQTMENAKQEMFLHLEEFQEQILRVLGSNQGGRSSQLGQEVKSFGEMLHNKLHEPLGKDGSISSSVGQFCHSIKAHIQELSTRLERHRESVEQNQGPSLQPSSDSPSLGEEFSTKLNILLQDILQNLH
ncbi:uncharacterized protein LOC108928692 [Scleropages formosus]|uniref:uncharacterized protein LOC108928692 n=1 Tax=Scleropages formosus TaxID=113540 RepID=UPI000877EA0B|nr:uncharacterized protein LOC108928692 [Scleropages formosus]